MSEGIHSASGADQSQVAAVTPTGLTAGTRQGNKNRTWTYLVAGLAVALAGAGVMFQFMRQKNTQAGVEQVGQGDEAGTARVAARGRALARVGKQIISWDDVAQEAMVRHGNSVLENIINRTVILQACEEHQIIVSEDEVNSEVARIAKKFNLPVDNWYQMLQTERGLNPVQYRRDVIWPMLALRKLAGERVEVTQQDMQRAFQRDYGPRVQAKMIMLDNFRRAQEVQEMARKNPAEFGRLARQHSVEPNSRSLDGDIPPIRRYSGSEQIEKAAFELRKGEVSGIIQLPTGRHVILMSLGLTEPVVDDITKVAEHLQEQIREEKTQASVAKVFEKIKKETRVDNFLTQTTTGGSRPAAGRPANNPMTDGNFSGDLTSPAPAAQSFSPAGE